MTLEDIKKQALLQTRSIAEACKDPKTHNYIVDCLGRFFRGDYGEICQEDTELNNEDLGGAKGIFGHGIKPPFPLNQIFTLKLIFRSLCPASMQITQ